MSTKNGQFWKEFNEQYKWKVNQIEWLNFLEHLYSKTGENVNLIVQGPCDIAGGAH